VFSTHLRIKDYLLSNVPVLHEEERDFFRSTLSVWQRRGIIDSYDLSIALWSEGTIHPGMPCPPPLPPPSGSISPDKEEENVGKVYKSFM